MSLFGPPDVEKLKGKRDVKRLVKALWYAKSSKDEAMRQSAIHALTEIGLAAPAAQVLLRSYTGRETSEWVTGILAEIGPQTIPALVASFSNDHERDTAVAALVRIGPPAIDPLVAAVRADLTATLRERPPYLMAKAERLLAEASSDLRVAASYALACRFLEAGADLEVLEATAVLTATREVLSALRSTTEAAQTVAGIVRDACVAVLGDRSCQEGPRASAARTLGRLGDRNAVSSLVAALEDDSAEIRRQAGAALSYLGDDRGLGQMVAALRHTAPADAAQPARNFSSVVRIRAAGALARLKHGDAVPSLIAALGDQDVDVRRNSADALGEIGDQRALQPLITALEDQSEGYLIGRETLKIMSRLGVASFDHFCSAERFRAVLIPHSLIDAQKPSSNSVRQAAARALGRLQDRRAVEPLLPLLKDEYWDVRLNAAAALGDLADPRSVDALIAALEDEDALVRREAVTSLGRIGDQRAAQAVMRSLDDPGGCVITEGMLPVAGFAAELYGPLKSLDFTVRRAATEALTRLTGVAGDRAETTAGPERVRCKQCGQFLVKATSAFGEMDEDGVLTFFKMARVTGLSDLGDGVICSACGGQSFEIVPAG